MASRLQPVWLWLLLIASLAFNAGVGATVGVRAYQHRWGEEANEGRPPKPGLPPDLDLSPEQSKEVHREDRTLKTDIDGYRGRLRELHGELAELVLADETNREAITATMNEIGEIRQEMRMRLVDHFLTIREKLDPEQRRILNKDFMRRLGRMGDGPPHMGRHRGGFRDRDHDGPRGERPPRRPRRRPNNQNDADGPMPGQGEKE